MGGGSGFSLLVRNVDELKNQGPSGDNAATSRQEISTDNVLENRRLASRLRTYDNLERSKYMERLALARSRKQEGKRRAMRAYNLREVERIVANRVEDQVLQLVDGGQQVVTECSHGARWCVNGCVPPLLGCLFWLVQARLRVAIRRLKPTSPSFGLGVRMDRGSLGASRGWLSGYGWQWQWQLSNRDRQNSAGVKTD